MRKVAFSRVLDRASATNQYREVLTPRNLAKHQVWLIFSVTCLFIGVASLVGYTHYASADSSVGDPPPMPPKYEDLLKKVREYGRVDVIVQFDADFQMEVNLTPEQLQQQHDGIQNARNRLIQDLSSYNVFVFPVSSDWIIPFVALLVDEQALQFLINCDYVKDISENHTLSYFQ